MTKPVFALALDSSSRRLTYALGRLDDPSARVFHRAHDKDFRHAEVIVKEIDRLLAEAGVRLSDVTHLVAGTGPGSFTGLRVGLAVVKAFCMCRPLKVWQVSSLDVIAQNVVSEHLPAPVSVAVLVDARRSRYYTAFYRWDGTGLVKLGPDDIFSETELQRRLDEPFFLLGDGLKTFSEKEPATRKLIRRLGETAWYPRAECMVRLAQQHSPLLKEAGLSEIAPSYLRPTGPEMDLMKLKDGHHGQA